MRFTTADIAAATQGRLVGPSVTVDGAATDSREVRGGELFVALHAERDGHAFVEAARERGAAAFLVDDDRRDGPGVAVADTGTAFTALASAGRDRADATVVGITGSVGKTTTKDMVAAVARTTLRTHASARSFNNDIGVPLTILGAPDDVQAMVVEIGASGPGEIERLAAIARPDVAVVTCVALAHAQGFGTIDGVAFEKSALVRSLGPPGTAVLNADDHRVAAMAALTPAAHLTFGSTPDADVQVRLVSLDGHLRPEVHAETPWGSCSVRLTARGGHQVVNAGAAIAVGGLLGVPVDAIAEGLATAPLTGGRMEVLTNEAGALVIDDSYNANPTSARAGLRALAAAPGRHRVAVLGAMAELGAASDAEHREVAAFATDLGIELITIGTSAYGVEPTTLVDALDRVGPLGAGDVILVKGSRSAGLDRFVDLLARTHDLHPTQEGPDPC